MDKVGVRQRLTDDFEDDSVISVGKGKNKADLLVELILFTPSKMGRW